DPLARLADALLEGGEVGLEAGGFFLDVADRALAAFDERARALEPGLGVGRALDPGGLERVDLLLESGELLLSGNLVEHPAPLGLFGVEVGLELRDLPDRLEVAHELVDLPGRVEALEEVHDLPEARGLEA